MPQKFKIEKFSSDDMKAIAESQVVSDEVLVSEALTNVIYNEESSDLYKNAGDSYNQMRAKQMTEQALQQPLFIKTQRDFIRDITEAASNTSVEYITSYRKLLPEVMARSINMSLAIENVAHVVPMPTESYLLSLHRRILGANSGTTEALHSQINSSFGGTGTSARPYDPFIDASGITGGSADADTTPADGVADNYSVGTGNTRIASEDLSFSSVAKVSNRIDTVTLTAQSRNVAMSISTEALQDARNAYGIDLVREGLITMQSELYRSVSAELYDRLVLVAKKDATFDFANVAASDADNFTLKSLLLLQQVNTMRAIIQTETKEPGLKFKIVATPKVIARLLMINVLHVNLTNANELKRDFDNISFYRGKVQDFEVYEAVNSATNATGQVIDWLMVVGKGDTASTSPIIYGNYVPFFLSSIMSADTSHQVYFGKLRAGMVANPFGMDNFSELLTNAQVNKCRYARAIRILGA